MRLSVTRVEELLRKYHGNQSAVARDFGVTRQAVSGYISRYPRLQAALVEANETILDHGESALYRAVLDGEAWAVKWLLATKGKGRGYVERQEVSGPDGGALLIEIVQRDTTGEAH